MRTVKTNSYKHAAIVVFLTIMGMKAYAQTNLIFEEIDGIVAVEAEHYTSQRKTDKRMWYLTDPNTDPSRDNEGNFSSTASGKAYMEILPDTRRTHADPLIQGENFTNTAGLMAIIEYKVYFNNPGRYYVWARCYSKGSEENGVHVGINGTWPASGQRMQWCDGKRTWRWESKQRTNDVHCGVEKQLYLDVPSAGIHTIAFSMREDGFRLDKWLMTKNINFQRPTDAGPAERIHDENGAPSSSGTTLTKTKITVYPVPVKHTLNISGVDISTAEVFSMAGQLLLEFTEVNDGLNISSLSNGLYILKLSDKRGTIETLRFVKE